MMNRLMQCMALLQHRLLFPLSDDEKKEFEIVTDYLCELLKEEVGLLKNCESAMKLIHQILQCIASLSCIDELYPIVLRNHIFVQCMFLCRWPLSSEQRVTILSLLLAGSSHPSFFSESVRQGLIALLITMKAKITERREIALFLFLCSVLVRYSRKHGNTVSRR